MVVSDDLEAYHITVQYKKNEGLTSPIKMKFSVHPLGVIEKTGIPSIDGKICNLYFKRISVQRDLGFSFQGKSFDCDIGKQRRRILYL